jgi:hypothetical protein
LRSRTLTALYNESPTWLLDLHATLDKTVFAAYGWDTAATDAELLAHLLARNLAPGRVNDFETTWFSNLL